MSRFSPRYVRQKPFTLYDGVMAAAGTLRDYTLQKRAMGLQDAEEERRGNREDRAQGDYDYRRDRDILGDETAEEALEYDRELDAVELWDKYGAVTGRPGESRGLPQPPTPEGPADGESRSIDPGFAVSPEAVGGRSGVDPGFAVSPEAVGGRSGVDPGFAVSPESVGGQGASFSDVDIKGTGIRGDWNGLFLQADDYKPIPGTRYFAGPRSGAMERERTAENEIAELLAGSPSRTGHAGVAGSQGRRDEALIQARTGQYVNPMTGSRGGLTAGQSETKNANYANFKYREAITELGMPHEAAVMYAVEKAGTHPNYGQTMDLPHELSRPRDRVQGRYGVAPPGVLSIAETLLGQGYDVNQVDYMSRYGKEIPEIGFGPSAAQQDSLASYYKGDYRRRGGTGDTQASLDESLAKMEAETERQRRLRQ